MLNPRSFIGGAAITPNATENLPRGVRGILATVAGTIHGITEDGSDLTFPAAVGVIYPIRFVSVKITGTTATGLVGFW